MTIAIIGEAIIDFIANPQGEYQPCLLYTSDAADE